MVRSDHMHHDSALYQRRHSLHHSGWHDPGSDPDRTTSRERRVTVDAQGC